MKRAKLGERVPDLLLEHFDLLLDPIHGRQSLKCENVSLGHTRGGGVCEGQEVLSMGRLESALGAQG